MNKYRRSVTFSVVLGASIISLAIFMFTTASAQSDLSGLKKADRYYKEGSFRLALEHYERAYPKLRRIERKSAVLFRIADCQFRLNHLKDSLANLGELIRLKPSSLYRGKTLLLKSRVLRKQNRWGNHEKILQLLVEAEKVFKDKALQSVRDDLISLYTLKIDQVLQRRWSDKNWYEEIKRCSEELIFLQRKTSEKAGALWRLCEISHSMGRTDKYKIAVSNYKRLLKEYPNFRLADKALNKLASIYEARGEFVESLKYYGTVVEKGVNAREKKNARTAIKRITTPAITIGVPKVFKPGEKIKLRLTTRNVGSVQLDVYRVGLEEILKEVGNFEQVEYYRLSRSDKNELSKKVKMQDMGKHRVLSKGVTLDLRKNGSYIIRGEGEGKISQVLLMISDMDIVMKSSSEKALVWVVDSASGRPIGNATVTLLGKRYNNKKIKLRSVISNKRGTPYSYKEVYRGKSDDSGIFVQRLSKKNYYEHVCMVKYGQRYAVNRGRHNYYGYDRGKRTYLQTDRPVYRPGQTVHFKAVLRDFSGEKYQNVIGQTVKVQVHDARGKVIKKTKLTSNEFGSISASFKLPGEAALGQYYIYLKWDHGQYHYFRVEEYKKPEYTVTVSPSEDQYRLGDEVKVKINSQYYFGEPVVGAKVKYTIHENYYYPGYYYPRKYSWYFDSGRRGRPYYGGYRSRMIKQGEGIADKNGNLEVVFRASFAPNDKRPEKYYRYSVNAEVVDKSRRMIKGQGTVLVGEKAFKAYLKPQRYLYSKKDKVKISVTTRSISGAPVASKGRIIIEKAKYNTKNKNYDFRKIESYQFKTGEKGNGVCSFTAKSEGYFRVRYRSVDKFDKPVEGSCWVWVAGRNFRGTSYKYRGIEIITDKDSYADGEIAHLLINSDEFENKYLLLSIENDRIHQHRVIKLRGQSNLVNLRIKEGYGPNAWLKAHLVSDYKLFSTSKEIVIPPHKNFININVSGGKEEFKPGEHAKFSVKATDRRGRPVSAEIALGIVDSSVFYISPDRTPDIRQYFYGQRRYNSVRTSTSFVNRKPARYSYYSMDGISGQPKEMIALSMAEDEVKSKRAQAPGKKKNGDKLAEAKIRSDFRDTAFWAPTVVTGRDGQAVVEVEMPESLTTWRITARGHTRNTMVGEIKTDVITRKKLMVRLQAPRFFTERDEVTLSAVVHNYLKQPVRAKVFLKVKGIDLVDSEPKWVTINEKEDVRIDFTAKIIKAGMAEITAYAMTTEESDAMQLKFPVIVHGVKKRQAFGGKVERDRALRFDLPSQRRKGETVLRLHLAPSIAGVILDSLDYLVKYPYGCVEQTMSRFLPSVVAARTLNDLGVRNEKLEKKLPDVVSKGLKRLYDFQHSDGGWGWWKKDHSSLYMTSYVYYGLSIASNAGYKVERNRLRNARRFMENILLHEEVKYPEITFALYSLAHGDKFSAEMKKKLLYLYTKRSKLNAYSKAMLAVILSRVEEKVKAETVLRNLYDYARIDKKSGKMSWAEHEKYWWYWYNDSVETTSMALAAYMNVKPKSEYVPMIVRWLVENRSGSRWKSTRDTAFTVLALTDYLKLSGELDAAYTALVLLGDREIARFEFTRKNVFSRGEEIILRDPEIPEGISELRIKKIGSKGELYFSASLTYFTLEEGIKGEGFGIKVDRSYYKIMEMKNGKQSRILIRNLSDLKSGDKVEVVLRITSDNNYEYLVFEDYKPAGMEALALVSGYDWRGGIASHREMRDEKVVFFVNWLPQGTHVLKYRLRAEVPGSFHAMPTIGYAMYSPRIYSISDEFRVKIFDNLPANRSTARE